MNYPRISISPTFLLVSFLSIHSALAGKSPTEMIPVPAEWRQVVENSAPPQDETRPALIVKIRNQPTPLILPMALDTSILNKDSRVQNKATDLQVRDNRFHQALFKVDVSKIPDPAAIESAQFRFKVGWCERPQPVELTIHEILTDWSEEATWFKPFPDRPEEWNGLRPGKDYGIEPLTKTELSPARPGVVTMDNLGPLLKRWVAGEPNFGFLLQLKGPGRQINIGSSETKPRKTPVKNLVLGGDKSGRVTMVINLAVLRRLILDVDDIHGMRIDFHCGKQTPPSSVSLRISDEPDSKTEVSGVRVSVGGSAEELRTLLKGTEEEAEFEISLLQGNLTVGGPDAGKENRPKLFIELKDYESRLLFEHPVAIQPGVYTKVRNGHLYYGDQRLRIWGALGYGNVSRIRKMGFNGWRLWPTANKAYSKESIRTGAFALTSMGDDSELDKLDKNFADFKENGFFIMATQLMGMPSTELLVLDDSFVAGGEDWEDWKVAVHAMTKGKDAAGPAGIRRMAFLDDRLKRARFQHAINFLNHVNPYTGKRYAEEEAVAIWELDNELRFVQHVLEGGVPTWPSYFQNKFNAKWNDWLSQKYGNTQALSNAWGKLNEGEELGSIAPAPTYKQAGEYPKARETDFVRFVIELADRFYQEMRVECKRQAPEGVGVAVQPFSFDTQYKPSIPWLYQQTRGDVANFGMYFWELKSSLENPPAAYVMDSHTVEGKPTIIYETNQGRPSPYRAEFPYKLMALASWQDWDAIFFHYWGAWDMETDEEFLVQTLKHVTSSHFWDGVHHHNDPVMTSAMAVAGRMFLNHSVKPAPNPAIVRLGANAIFSHSNAKGVSMSRDTFSVGSRIRFEPDSQSELVIENGTPDLPNTGPVSAGNEITWDWPTGRLIIDSPSAHVFVGPVPAEPVKFHDEITVSGFDSSWIAFGLTSLDGTALTECNRVLASAVFEASNTGFEMNWKVSGGPVDQANAISNRGSAPMRVDKPDYTISFPQQLDWKFQGYDFALREIANGKGSSNALRIRNKKMADSTLVQNPHAQELWMGLIEFTGRGKPMTPIADSNPGAQPIRVSKASDGASTTDATLAGVWNPIPDLSWGDGYSRAHKILRDAPIRFLNISPEKLNIEGSETIRWSGARVLFGLPADIEVFARGLFFSVDICPNG